MSFCLRDEIEAVSGDVEAYEVANEFDASQASASEITAALNGVVDALAGQSEAITQSDTLDTIKSLLKHSHKLQPQHLNKLLDSLCSGLNAELEATVADAHPSDHAPYRSHQTALEVYAFAIQWFVSIAEKSTSGEGEGGVPVAAKKPRGKPTTTKKPAASTSKSNKNAASRNDWSWAASIPSTLDTLSNVLSKLKSDRIWQTTQERDVYLSCFVKPANRIAESEVYMKMADVRAAYYRLLALACKHHGQSFSVQTAVSQNLAYTEHLAEPMAAFISVLCKEYDYTQCGEEVLREVAAKNFQDKADIKITKSFGSFLVALATSCPRLVLKQIVMLQKHMDSESYTMRNAMVEVFGHLIQELATSTADLQEGGAGANGLGDDADRQANNASQISQFFDILIQRFLDSNSFVRSKTVQVLTKLLDLPAKFPEKRMKITRKAIQSLSDKASIVRKNCIILLDRLITTHPYGVMHGGDLNATRWAERYHEIERQLKPVEEALKNAAEQLAQDSPRKQPAPAESDGEDKAPGASHPVEATEDDVDAGASEEPAESQNQELNLANLRPDDLLSRLDTDQLSKLRLIKRYYADAIDFVRLLDGDDESPEDKARRNQANGHEHRLGAIDKVTELLNSTTKSEVLEAMNFLTTCHQYKMEAATRGVRAMLHLVWAKESSTVEEDGKEVKGVRPSLVKCYKQLYFEDDPSLDEKANITRVAKNLIDLTYGATLADLTSLEELLSIMMNPSQDEVNIRDEVIEKLWQVYASQRDITRNQRRGTIIILGMLAAQRPEIVAEQTESLVKIGLGAHGRNDLVLAKYSCLALRRLAGSQKKVKGSLKDASIRYSMDNQLFQALAKLLELETDSREWFGMAEEAINTIYVLGDQPDKLCSHLLQNLTKQVFNPPPVLEEPIKEESVPLSELRAEDGDEAQDNQVRSESVAESQAEQTMAADTTAFSQATLLSSGPRLMTSASKLAQLIFIAGHLAIKHLVYLELAEKELKRRKEAANAPVATGNTATKEKPDELDQVAGSVEDELADLFQETKERELLYGPRSLLAIYGPMTVQICQYPKQYRNRTLRVAAVLSLCKFMCVSAKFCEDHLMMLFKIFETTPDPIIKSNIIIALGDIAVAFSTIMDDNSDRLYAGLSNTDIVVKKNTLMVLTHLILNGMIKVKGQLGQMAKCLEDDEQRIKDLAKLFFSELATKDNAIYNNLPDIVSSLSSGNYKVTEEMFEKTMTFIFKFIDKEKQAEAIIEKLCQRFKFTGENLEGSTDAEKRECEERRWRDIALCLSMLPYKSERSIKKLIDALPLYQDKLYEGTVYKRFTDILTKARSAKQKDDSLDYKDFEAALEEHKQKGSEDVALERKVEKKKRAVARKKPAAKKATKKQRVEESEEEAED